MSRVLDLAFARNLNRDFDLVLVRDRDLAFVRDLNRDLVRDLVRNLDGVRDHDLDRDRIHNLAHALNRLLGRDLARYRDLVRNLDLDLARVLDRDLARARDLARNLDRACDLLLDLDLNRDLVVAIKRASAFARRLEDLLLEAHQRTHAADTAAPARPTVAAVAAGLARASVRILPPASRPRYGDEFASELYELAAAKASRWAQLRYGLQLLDRAWVLRAELREAAAQRVRS